MAFYQLLLLPLLASSCLVGLSRGGNLGEEAARLGATTVVDLLKQVGLGKNLETDYLTLFLPTNEAFNNLNEGVAIALTNTSVLTGVLLFHASNGIFRSVDAVDDMLIKTTLPGSSIRVNTYDNDDGSVFVTLNGAKVVQADVAASNGIVHLIDRVMLPPVGNMYELVAMSDVHKTLKTIIDTVGFQQLLETTTGTLFAPTDAAFAELQAMQKAGKVVGDFSTLATKETTMFHLLPKVLYSAGARNGTYTTMDKGEKLTVTVTPTGAMINKANVVIADIPASNGVIHVIDKVLIPDSYMVDAIVG